MHDGRVDVTGGVDTHGEQHVAAVVDAVGRILGTAAFPANAAGYRRLLRWMGSFGQVTQVGVEGTGAYGAGLARYLTGQGVLVVEVNRPNRQSRRRRGKSDTTDAEAAARAALNGEASGLPKAGDGPVEAMRTLRCLARRHQALTTEIGELDQSIGQLCAQAGPALLAARGVGPEVASVLLIAAGDEPARMRTEASFAALCGSSPVEASSGKITRHRLNQGGDREANNALWRIAMVRLTCDQRTRDYAARRRSEGKSDREIIRCLKRYIAREVYQLITDPPAVPDGASLRAARTAAGISLATAAGQLSTWPTRISELERGLKHDADLASRYQQWLSQKTT